MVTVQEAEGQFMPIREAARLLCVHANTLRRWGDRGIIRAYRLGDSGHRRFLRQDVVNLRYYLLSHGGNPLTAHLYSTPRE
jgi:excisionase family DNA binding protein